jgi:HTH-type transcriptional regulator/antitoxin HigA
MSAASNKDDGKEYFQLMKRFPLRPIRNDEQNMLAAEICDSLTERLELLSPAEKDYLEVLTELILAYESKWNDENANLAPRELLLSLMKQNGFAQKDLISEFGSASRVSEFLSGERRLSLEQAKKLALRFRLKIATLID